jgi:hypothetical protein
MPNMSYCRFENTLHDLRDCYNALRDGAKDDEEMLPEERKAMERLIRLSGDIYHEYEDYPTCQDDEDE